LLTKIVTKIKAYVQFPKCSQHKDVAWLMRRWTNWCFFKSGNDYCQFGNSEGCL